MKRLATVVLLLALLLAAACGPTPAENHDNALAELPVPTSVPPPQVADPGSFEVPRPTTAARVSRNSQRVSPKAAVKPQPKLPVSVTGDIWWRLALCESGGRQHAHSSTGKYHSYFQWSLATWHSLGMSGDPHNYPYAVQLEAAKRLQARSGWNQWPACSRRLGLR